MAATTVVRPAADISLDFEPMPSTAAEVVQILTVLALMLAVALAQSVM